jgi:RND family efflux transporter MFP subunit
MKRMNILGIVVFFLLLTIANCTKKDQGDVRSMAQIYQEEGVPVRVETVKPRTFKTVLKFNSVLRGIKESTAYAAMGDKVEKIHVRVGDLVKKDQVLVTFPTDSPSAKYYQAKVAFENAKTAFKRIDNLYMSGGISLQERDNAKAGYDVAAADWNAVKQMVKVKAPIAGYVAKIHVSETDNVDKEMALVTISQTKRMKAAIWISEDEISEIEKGIPATASWKGNSVEGEVVQVDMAMNYSKKAFRAQVEFDNSENQMKAGTTVDILITTSTKTNAIVMERKNILREKEENFVFVINKDKAEKRVVALGKQQGLDTEIIRGLKIGDRLVVEGHTLLENGTKVKIVAKGK